MNQLRILTHLMKADFLQRIRTFGFVIVAALAVYISYLYVPPVTAGYVTMSMGPIRGIYNSAWVGVMFGIVASTILPMFVFYVIKNSVERDRQTRVGQIIASTPISKPVYLLGKWLSNLAVLSLILIVMTVMAGVMQWIRGEETAVYLPQLITPIWLLGLPVMGFVSALAVLFESIPFLRGGFGNIVYFFLWNMIVVMAIPGNDGFVQGTNDLLGITRPFYNMQQQIIAINPAYAQGFTVGSAPYEHIDTFVWEGIQWTMVDVGQRVLWLLAGIGIVIVAALPFDRFDTARSKSKERRLSRWQHAIDRLLGKVGLGNADVADEKMTAVSTVRLTPIHSTANYFRFKTILVAELRLALKGLPWWWFAVVLGVFIAELVNPIETGLRIALAAMIWPMLVLSSLGTRERNHHTQKIIFSAASPLRRQLPATWLAGVLVSALMCAGIALRLVIAAEWAHLLAVVIGTLFVPSLALALGVWSGVNRLFEVLFLFWWYLALNGVPALDFMSATVVAPTLVIPLVYLAASAGLLGTAVIGRQFKLQ
ncbi:MAG: hypothetical protein GY943_23090 [Chloroflexi bacterium]|nr:hypothetical protein [Chloroflexota bacterium]